MLARFRVLPPYTISIRQGDSLAPEEFDRNGYRIRVYPPYEASTSIRALDNPGVVPSDLVYALHPADPGTVDASLTINGNPAIPANAIRVDVFKDEFDRTAASASHASSDDPPIEMLFDVVNSLLHRLRSVGRAYPIHPISVQGSYWRLEYLTDSENELASEEGKFRARAGATGTIRISGITEASWNAARGLPSEFRTKAWEALLLDAEAHLPDITPALVLAAGAIEILIEYSLTALAPLERLPAELWSFINNRGDYRKEPSVAEQYDQLLHALTGHTLKERADLWDAFRHIRDARNSLMHEGTLMIAHQPVSKQQAFELIGKAKEIADWIENLLPASTRRPVCPTMSIECIRPIIINRSAPS